MFTPPLALALVHVVWSRYRSHACALILGAVGLFVTGCSGFTIVAPQNGATSVTSPVGANVTWNDSGMSSIHFTVDGADQTSAFSITNLSNGGSATASLPLSLGSHSLVVSGDYYFAGTIHTSASSAFTVIGPFFTLSPSPNPLTLAPGAAGTLTMSVNRGGGFSGPVTVTFSGLPPGVSANPSPLTIPATSGSGQAMLTATSATATGQFPISVSGSSGTLTNQQSFTLAIAWPTPNISSVNPKIQPRGSTVTVTGTNFAATCANDGVSVGGVNNFPPAAPCTTTSLSYQVPQQAAYGAAQLTVSSHGQVSNAMAVTVARTPGQFTEITSNIEGQTSNQTCSPGGTVKVSICSGVNCSVPTDPFTATFNRTTGGAQVGQPIGFHKNSSNVSGIGGAGFSLCTVGAVLDADATSYSPQAMGIEFLDLGTGHLFPPGGFYTFNYGTPSGTASYVPRIFRSPDGTILIVVTASTIGPSQLTAAVFDQINQGSPDLSCQSANASSSFSASITASNQISASLAGTSCTITIH